MKVDVDALATWILEKAQKQHDISPEHPHARGAVVLAVKRAVQADGDELHITCRIDSIAIEERMSRTAAENLFAPPPPHYEKKRAAEEPAEAPRSRREEPAKAPPWMLPLFVALIAATVSFVVWLTTRHSAEHDERHEKREMRH